MKEELIKYETAKLAFDKGFNCGTSIFNYEVEYIEPDYKTYVKELNWIVEDKYWNSEFRVCTQGLLQKYIREKYHIIVESRYVGGLTKKTAWYDYLIYYDLYPKGEQTMKYKTYEEALEVGLYEALKLIK